jgi:hypothetical protein
MTAPCPDFHSSRPVGGICCSQWYALTSDPSQISERRTKNGRKRATLTYSRMFRGGRGKSCRNLSVCRWRVDISLWERIRKAWRHIRLRYAMRGDRIGDLPCTCLSHRGRRAPLPLLSGMTAATVLGLWGCLWGNHPVRRPAPGHLDDSFHEPSQIRKNHHSPQKRFLGNEKRSMENLPAAPHSSISL